MNKLNGIILCGGKSSRMGEDKGLLSGGNKTLMEYAIELLNPYVDKLIICSNNIEYHKFNLAVFPDIIKNIGPAGGIYTGLTHSDTDINFVISCDMPFVDTQLIELLIHSYKKENIAMVPIHDDKIEPLIAIYSRDFKETLDENIQKGIFKLNRILREKRGVQFLDISHEILRKKNLLLNINTPYELKQFRSFMS